MLVTSLRSCEEIVAGDGTSLRELLHPDRHPVDCRYSLAHARLAPGAWSLLHVLSTREVYYVLAGRGIVEIDGQQQEVSAGDAIYIPPGSRQRILNMGAEDLEFLCIVDPAWRAEDERVVR